MFMCEKIYEQLGEDHKSKVHRLHHPTLTTQPSPTQGALNGFIASEPHPKTWGLEGIFFFLSTFEFTQQEWVVFRCRGRRAGGGCSSFPSSFFSESLRPLCPCTLDFIGICFLKKKHNLCNTPSSSFFSFFLLGLQHNTRNCFSSICFIKFSAHFQKRLEGNQINKSEACRVVRCVKGKKMWGLEQQWRTQQRGCGDESDMATMGR